MIKNIITWVNKLLGSSDEISTKRVAYLVIVVASVFWLSFSLHHDGITPQWLDGFKTVVTVISSGYVLGKAVDKIPTNKDKEND